MPDLRFSFGPKATGAFTAFAAQLRNEVLVVRHEDTELPFANIMGGYERLDVSE